MLSSQALIKQCTRPHERYFQGGPSPRQTLRWHRSGTSHTSFSKNAFRGRIDRGKAFETWVESSCRKLRILTHEIRVMILAVQTFEILTCCPRTGTHRKCVLQRLPVTCMLIAGHRWDANIVVGKAKILARLLQSRLVSCAQACAVFFGPAGSSQKQGEQLLKERIKSSQRNLITKPATFSHTRSWSLEVQIRIKDTVLAADWHVQKAHLLLWNVVFQDVTLHHGPCCRVCCTALPVCEPHVGT